MILTTFTALELVPKATVLEFSVMIVALCCSFFFRFGEVYTLVSPGKLVTHYSATFALTHLIVHSLCFLSIYFPYNYHYFV